MDNERKYMDDEKSMANTLPFDAEQAKQGKPVCTKDGRPVRILCYDRDNDLPIVALIREWDGEQSVATYTMEGVAGTGDAMDNLAIIGVVCKGYTAVLKDAPYNPEKLPCYNDRCVNGLIFDKPEDVIETMKKLELADLLVGVAETKWIE
jgi:hypothetical protein